MTWTRLLVVLAAVYVIPPPASEPGRQDSPLPGSNAQRRYEFTEIHMGLPVRVVLYAQDEAHARRAGGAAFARVAVLDQMMSDYRPDSEVRGLEGNGRSFRAVSRDLFRVLALAVEVAQRTDGAFDPTVGPLTVLWREARKVGRLPEAAALAAARQRVGWTLLELDRRRQRVRLKKDGMRLDLGGIAKGYILQAALKTLGDHGVRVALVESGGDLVVGEAPPGRAGWRIEVGAAAADVSRRAAALVREAFATSGPAAQGVQIDDRRYSHIVDPRTGMALTSPTTVSVIAKDAALADALATALTVLGPEGAVRVRAAYPQVGVSVSAQGGQVP